MSGCAYKPQHNLQKCQFVGATVAQLVGHWSPDQKVEGSTHDGDSAVASHVDLHCTMAGKGQFRHLNTATP